MVSFHSVHAEALYSITSHSAVPCHISRPPQKVHANFIEQLANKIDEVKAGEAAVDDQLVLYMQNWLKNHIRGTDFREYPK